MRGLSHTLRSVFTEITLHVSTLLHIPYSLKLVIFTEVATLLLSLLSLLCDVISGKNPRINLSKTILFLILRSNRIKRDLKHAVGLATSQLAW